MNGAERALFPCVFVHSHSHDCYNHDIHGNCPNCPFVAHSSTLSVLHDTDRRIDPSDFSGSGTFPDLTEPSSCSTDCQPLTDSGLCFPQVLFRLLHPFVWKTEPSGRFLRGLRGSEGGRRRAAVWAMRRLAKRRRNQRQHHLVVFDSVAV